MDRRTSHIKEGIESKDKIKKDYDLTFLLHKKYTNKIEKESERLITMHPWRTKRNNWQKEDCEAGMVLRQYWENRSVAQPQDRGGEH